jgi:lipoate-protein ligase A
LQIVESGPKSPFENMLVDEMCLRGLSEGASPLLRFYEWEGFSATYGYFIDPKTVFSQAGVSKWGLEIARRPTGGGVIFHQGDLAFSLVVPKDHSYYSLNSLDSYLVINKLVLDAILEVFPGGISGSLLDQKCSKEVCKGGFCMAKPTQFDILIDGKKVGGAAQRKTRNGLLHQGSICLEAMDEGILRDVLLEGAGAIKLIQENSYPLLQKGEDGVVVKQKLKKVISEHLDRI